MAAANCMCNAADMQLSPATAFAAVPLTRLRGGGLPNFWVNQKDLHDAPERWKGGLAKLRAMCDGSASPGGIAESGKASRLAGIFMGWWRCAGA